MAKAVALRWCLSPISLLSRAGQPHPAQRRAPGRGDSWCGCATPGSASRQTCWRASSTGFPSFNVLAGGPGSLAECSPPLVGLRDLPEAVRAGVAAPPARLPAASSPAALEEPGTLRQSKAEAEVRRIREALQKHLDNRARVAAELGLSRMGLYKKLRKYGLLGPAAAAPQ